MKEIYISEPLVMMIVSLSVSDHLVVVGEVVSVLDALVAPDDVEQLVVCQEPRGHVRPEEAREAARVGEAAGLVLKIANGLA